MKGFYVIMGSGMSNIKTDILIETTVYIEISNKMLELILKYGQWNVENINKKCSYKGALKIG